MKHLIDIKDLSVKEIDEMIKVAKDIISHPEKYSHKCDNNMLVYTRQNPNSLSMDLSSPGLWRFFTPLYDVFGSFPDGLR